MQRFKWHNNLFFSEKVFVFSIFSLLISIWIFISARIWKWNDLRCQLFSSRVFVSLNIYFSYVGYVNNLAYIDTYYGFPFRHFLFFPAHPKPAKKRKLRDKKKKIALRCENKIIILWLQFVVQTNHACVRSWIGYNFVILYIYIWPHLCYFSLFSPFSHLFAQMIKSKNKRGENAFAFNVSKNFIMWRK